jgi:translation initiation factor IF-3
MKDNEKYKFNINNRIKHDIIRLVGNNIESEIVNTSEALRLAKDMDVDLIEIVPNAKPPVCKLIKLDKHIYELKQKEKEKIKNQKKNAIKLKEIRLSYNMGKHDFDFKLKHAINFLENNMKVKLTMFFGGRKIQFKENGEYQMVKFIDELKDHGKIENMPKLDNRRLWCVISPKKQ